MQVGHQVAYFFPGAWPRRRHAFTIQGLGDGLERLPFRRHLEDAANHRRFALVDDQLLSRRSGYRDRVITKAASARMLAPQHQTFESAVGFLGKLLHVQAVHHAMNGDKHMRLFVLRVDALTDGDQPDAGEVQPLEDASASFVLRARRLLSSSRMTSKGREGDKAASSKRPSPGRSAPTPLRASSRRRALRERQTREHGHTRGKSEAGLQSSVDFVRSLE